MAEARFSLPSLILRSFFSPSSFCSFFFSSKEKKDSCEEEEE